MTHERARELLAWVAAYLGETLPEHRRDAHQSMLAQRDPKGMKLAMRFILALEAADVAEVTDQPAVLRAIQQNPRVQERIRAAVKHIKRIDRTGAITL